MIRCYTFLFLSILFYGVGYSQPGTGDYDIGVTDIDGVEIRYVKDEILVKPDQDVDISDIAADLEATVIASIPRIGWYRLKFQPNFDVIPTFEDIQDDARIQATALHEIISMEEPHEYEEEIPNDRDEPPEEIQWPLTITGATQAWNRISESNILIAILDTGIDQDHYEVGEFATSHDKIEVGVDWFDYYGQFPPNKDWQPAWDQDDVSPAHGTHRVGEIAAPFGNGGISGVVAGWDGPNHQKCKVLVEKVAQNQRRLSIWGVAMALDYVVFERNARVVSCSFSGVHGTYALIWWDVFNSIEFSAPGTVVMCAAGNDGSQYSIGKPAAWSCDLNCVIAVGATTQNDQLNYETSWIPGPGTLNILAPGHLHTYYSTSLNGFYDMEAGGTSAATAHAAGIAAMMISKNPDLVNHEIKTRLQDTAYRIQVEECSWGSDPDDCWGHECYCLRAGSGRIDAVRCLLPRYQVMCPRGSEAAILSS